MRILVVDDRIAMRRILVNTLKRLGYSDIVEAAGGHEGLERLDAGGIDVIVTDWIMPEMDGLEFVRRTRGMDAHKDIPIVMVTTQGTREDILEAARAGVDGYVVKPFVPDTLRQKIEELTSRPVRA